MFNWKPIRLASVLAVAVAVPVFSPVAAHAEEYPGPAQVYSNGSKVGATPIQIEAWGKLHFETGLGPLGSGIGPVECITQFYGTAWNAGGTGAGRAEIEAWTGHTCVAQELEETFHQKAFVEAEPPLEFVEHESVYCTQTGKKLSECPNTTERTTGTAFTGLKRRLSTLPWKVELKWEYSEELFEYVVRQRLGLAEFGESGTSAAKSTKCYPKNANGEPEPFTKVPAGCVVLDVVVPQVLGEFIFYGTLEPEALEGIANGLSPAGLDFHGESSGKLVSAGNVYGEAADSGELKILGASGQQLVEDK